MADPLAGLADVPAEQKRALEDAIEQMQVRDRCKFSFRWQCFGICPSFRVVALKHALA